MNNNSFINQLATESNFKETENGAVALKSTNSAIMDLFGTIGAFRYAQEDTILKTFIAAYGEDRLLALKTLFYARDARGGLGERETFKTILKWLAENRTDDVLKNLDLIPEFGRWDDLYCLVGTPVENAAFELMKSQFNSDIEKMKNNETVSILAKWLKSVKTSSRESSMLGRLTAKKFGLTEKEYRKKLSMLRSYLDVVETKMSVNKWNEIDYSTVPSKASNIYRDAFARHDEDGYNAFLTAVENGDAKINASVLYPYDIVEKYLNNGVSNNRTLEAQWNSLPNYVTRNKDFLIMADVSGSMEGRPMATSVGLAVYFAERNKGLYHGKFMTFGESPSLVSIPDSLTLKEKLDVARSAEWGFNTNLNSAFSMVLNSAKKAKAKQDELPEAIVVITDMEIDDCDSHIKETIMKKYERMFEEAGYKLPVIIWWNVNARQNTFHAEYNDKYVRFISGSSASVFESLCENLGDSAEELMMKTLNSKRYSEIK